MSTDVPVGFTGEWNDPATMGYPLGNGYRWYLPGLMRFNAPDSLSPFGAGGANPYVYCGADPINRTDPSGHLSTLANFAEDLARGIESDALTAVSARNSATTVDPVLKQIHAAGGKSFRFVAIGFSELDYKNPAEFEGLVEKDLKPIVERYGAENVTVWAGGTPEGVGRIYRMAKRYGLRTRGIVSDAAKAYPGGISEDVDEVIYVPRPKDNWEVISPYTGHSYTVSAALGDGSEGDPGGAIFAYGGGDIGVTETEEAIRRHVPYHLHAELEPNPEKVAKRLLTKPNLNPTPMRALADRLRKANRLLR